MKGQDSGRGSCRDQSKVTQRWNCALQTGGYTSPHPSDPPGHTWSSSACRRAGLAGLCRCPRCVHRPLTPRRYLLPQGTHQTPDSARARESGGWGQWWGFMLREPPLTSRDMSDDKSFPASLWADRSAMQLPSPSEGPAVASRRGQVHHAPLS